MSEISADERERWAEEMRAQQRTYAKALDEAYRERATYRALLTEVLRYGSANPNWDDLFGRIDAALELEEPDSDSEPVEGHPLGAPRPPPA